MSLDEKSFGIDLPSNTATTGYLTFGPENAYGTISAGGIDTDWYHMHTDVGFTYVVTLLPNSFDGTSSLGAKFDVRDQFGNIMAYSSANGQAQQWLGVANSTDYYIEVTSPSAGGYSLRADNASKPEQTSDTPLVSGETLTDTLTYTGEEHTYALQLAAGTTYYAAITFATLADPYLQLVNPFDQVVSYTSAVVGRSYSYTPTISGTYKLEVSSNSFIGRGSYSITDYITPSANPDFDVAYYLQHNPDVAAAGVDPEAHFTSFGWREGRNPDAFFDIKYYLNQNPDVAAAGIDPLVHYETDGWKEGRDPSASFSTRAYLRANPDVAAAQIDPLMHYLHNGALEGRLAFVATPHGVGPQDPLVDNTYYFSQYADIRAAGVDPSAHYASSGWREGRNPDALFDTNFYLRSNPDVAAAGIDPLLHYENFGWREGRDPSAAFSTAKYLAAYSDVRAAGIDPLVHYENFGIQEGRAAFHE
ncbi:hypothetical protein [Rhodopila sp.]|uniref:hypothetical protein n=1 Tax=Rhodopila sp. TaxID=2480087 RepID=UPI003D1048B3